MTAKFFLSLLLLVIGCGNLFGQTPLWEWEESAFGTNSEILNSIAVDDSGNVYVTGHFGSDTLSVGNFTLIKDSLSAWSSALYIIKYDKTGSVQWAKSVGGTMADVSLDASIDKQNSVQITGYFRSPKINFDGDTLVKDTANNTSDIFVAKLNNSGNTIWAKSAGGTNLDEGQSICTDNQGNIYVTGIFQSPQIIFGSDTVIQDAAQDIFLVKYDSSGNVKWTKSGASIYNDNEGYHVACDGNGNAYIMGQYYNDTIYFDSIPLLNKGSIDDDFFIIKYDSSGKLMWAKSEGGNYYDFGESICVGSPNEFYVGGCFRSDTITFGNYTLIKDTSPQRSDIFIVKYDSSGTVLWAERFGGTLDDIARVVKCDKNGNVIVAGEFDSPSISFGSTTLTKDSASVPDIFIAMLNSAGNVLWAKKVGGSKYDNCRSVGADALGNIYVGGWFQSSVLLFDSDSLVNSNSNPMNFSYDIFVAKLSSTTGIPEVNGNPNQIIIFPNPSDGYITVKSNNKIDRMEITDLLGQVIFKSSINENEFSFQLKNSGTYLLHTITNNSIETRKLIVVQ